MQPLYFIGLEYPTMTGLAIVSKGLGFAVSGVGSGISSILSQQLQQAGIHHYDRYAANHIPRDGVVVIAPQIAKNNPELKQAMSLELEIVSLPQFIQQLSQNQQRIAVLGSGLAAGQIYQALAASASVDYIGQQPLVNPQDQDNPQSVFFQASPQVVIEANLDQSSSLDLASQALYYLPDLLVIVQPEAGYRHPVAFYKNLQHLLDDMVEVDSKLKTRVILVDPDKKTADLVIRSGLGHLTCGQDPKHEWQARKTEFLDQKTIAWIYKGKTQVDMVSLPQVGRESLWATLAALAVADCFDQETSQALLAITGQDQLYYQHREHPLDRDNHLLQILVDPRYIDDLQLRLTNLLGAHPNAEDQHRWVILLDGVSELFAQNKKSASLLPKTDILLISQSSTVKSKPAHLTKAAPAVYCITTEQIIRFVRQNIGHGDTLFVISSTESNLAEFHALYQGLPK